MNPIHRFFTLRVPDDAAIFSLVAVVIIFLFWSYILIPTGYSKKGDRSLSRWHVKRWLPLGSHFCLGMFFLFEAVTHSILAFAVYATPRHMHLWELVFTLFLGLWGSLAFLYIGREEEPI